jgi:rsbT co-antagonist protein RsbR
MKSGTSSQIAKVLQEQEPALLAGWTEGQLSSSTLRADLIKESELREDSRQFLNLFLQAAQKGDIENMKGAEWERLREFLHRLSSSRAQ